MKNPASRMLFCAVVALLGITACRPAFDDGYRDEISKWDQERLQSLKSAQGWASLAGLFWLQPGANSFGADTSNAIKFPETAPGQLGICHLDPDSVWMEFPVDQTVLTAGQPVSRIKMWPVEGSTPTLEQGSLRWTIIRRGEKVAIRLWDSLSASAQDLHHINRFPVDPVWKLPVKFIPADTPQVVRMKNVLDMNVEQKSPGHLELDLHGKTYSLPVLEENEDEFFLLFSDATTGETTYGMGRYLLIPKPAAGDPGTTIDFNKAYNPPCAFTKFATCLLPPAENRIDVPITAGEMNYGEH